MMPSHQYACFACRKSFKRPQPAGALDRFMLEPQRKAQRAQVAQAQEHRSYACPNCGRETSFMGIDFKAPKMTDTRGWKVAEEFIKSGKVFYRGVV